MHMNSVPQYLQSEDRQEFERLLDEALRSAPHRPELAAVGQRLNLEQLRTMALNASALITAAATAEYQHYVKVREQLRHPAMATSATGDSGSTEPGSATAGLVTSFGDAAENTGAGAIAVIAVLAPVLSGTAAAIFLLVGYILKTLGPGQAFAQTMLTAGWVFGAVTAAAILVAAVGLLLTALRNGNSPQAQALDAAHRELDKARAAWRDALLERGILPFLREALAEPGPAALHRTTPPAPNGRMPRLGYDRPGFSSPGDGTDSDRPSFTSPDYTSPDFGGPEHQPE
ncbi:membrane protein [Streptomyces roseochromogenus]|uniref:Membrane protein n=1 Tax=Streptomyces roseochromogenus subsp. oscitans DS 12.976 TaxID=1352936 RepID=V6KB17_STRRC|nr:membrane protein [Streptomyces roseochromogenus]EST28636.1 membrane protein [Streptomyces roseochromogenus subsp. oscitans DS 12.976]